MGSIPEGKGAIMKTININLSRELNNVEIITIADWHIGNPTCNYQLIQQEIDYIKNNENVYAILNGDILENITKTSLGDIYTQKMSPMEQLHKAIELLTPIKDKILCVTSGNHCDRSYRTDGVDLMRIVTRELGIEHKYSNASCTLFIRLGETERNVKETNGSGKRRQICYTVYVVHGSSGGGTIGAKSNAVSRLQSIIDTDIYVMSHLHSPNTFKESYHRVDVRNNTVQLVDKLFVITGAKVDWNGSYAEKKSLKPSSLVNPIIHLNGKRKEFTATL